MANRRVNSEEIEQAKTVGIMDYLDANGLEVKQQGNGQPPYYNLVENDSLVIQGEKYYWNSRQEGGYGAIHFAMTYHDLSFPDAVRRINEHEYALDRQPVQQVEKEPFSYPSHYEVADTSNVRDYLVNDRKVDERVVDWCLNKDLIVQDRKDNCVMKWKDREGETIGADRQGTQPMEDGKHFKGVVKSSAEDGGFAINVGKNIDKIALFESPIDALSYWSEKKGDVQNTRLQSMSGLKIQAVKRGLQDLQADGHKVTQVISAVDNDAAGEHFHDKLNDYINPDAIVDHRPTNTKDWNEEREHGLQQDQKRPPQAKQSSLSMGLT
ncbi:hypothetical protein CHL76_12065 [Marinococcus halophilus]|uniref:DUF3991 domain-containing protein n=1 Tax=Marinococcus halophilus TaxID=1371 RepID=A0A510Y7S8_MARHA|nr:DUF3991 domain-containing protein [Marinococcus halophilus]OZT79641.1 hypothetical protein CHL76_12065 [Marinococcus halophilus]GEK59419.1 hypothetical protein MHA01_23240 [Marinococcus halophilus]